tara:strand:- start:233 stop:931 length:699 start_codon:yes stop_codon:yes gene_type:complete
MNIAIHSLHWTNLNPKITENHKKVYTHFGFPVTYTNQNIDHGQWMTHMCRETDYDIIVFADADCVPITRSILEEGVAYCEKTGGMIGPAQASNHFTPPHNRHIFCAPSFLMLTRDAYEKMNKPSLEIVPGISDAAQTLSRVSDDLNLPRHCWYPTKYENGGKTGNPLGYDPLGSYGRYGIGTVYGDNKLYHLYESRVGRNAELFERRCDSIIANTFDTSEFLNSTTPLPDGK